MSKKIKGYVNKTEEQAQHEQVSDTADIYKELEIGVKIRKIIKELEELLN